MKTILLFVLAVMPLFGKEYFAKVEPYEVRTLASNVTGLVVKADETKEGEVLGMEPFIKIDSEIDFVELSQARKKIVLLQNMLKHNVKMIENYEQVLEKKEANYKSIKELKVKSDIEKDREFYDLVASENQYLSALKEVENINLQINDLRLRKAQLRRSIDDKKIAAAGYVLYKLLVKPGQVVSPGTPLAEVADVRSAQLTLFVTEDEVEGIEDKVIYIDGQKTGYKIERLWPIADAQHLSSYRVEIIIKAPERFSKLVKVEFKSE